MTLIKPSPFLAKPERWLFQDDHAFVFENEYPVLKGHVLIAPKREVENFFDLSQMEWKSVYSLAEQYIKSCGAIAFNLALNHGKLAGQSVAHIHIHVFPHFEGSAGMPKGGYANAFGTLPEYYKK